MVRVPVPLSCSCLVASLKAERGDGGGLSAIVPDGPYHVMCSLWVRWECRCVCKGAAPEPLPGVSGARDPGHRFFGPPKTPLRRSSQQKPQGLCISELQIPGGGDGLGLQVKFGCCPGDLGCKMKTQ